MRGGKPNEDKDEGWGEWAAGTTIDGYISSIPLIGKSAMLAWDTLARNKWRGTQYDAVVTPFVQLARAWKLWNNEKKPDPWRAAWLAIEGMALMGAPVPATGFRRAVEAAEMMEDAPLFGALNLAGIRVKRK